MNDVRSYASLRGGFRRGNPMECVLDLIDSPRNFKESEHTSGRLLRRPTQNQRTAPRNDGRL